MCLNGLKCAQNARKLHFESTKFSSRNMPPKLLVKLAQITHVKSWIHPCYPSQQFLNPYKLKLEYFC